MSEVLVRDRKGEDKHREEGYMKEAGRECSYAPISQGMPGARS